MASYIDIEEGIWNDEEHQNETSTIRCTIEELDAIDNQGEEDMTNTTTCKELSTEVEDHADVIVGRSVNLNLVC